MPLKGGCLGESSIVGSVFFQKIKVSLEPENKKSLNTCRSYLIRFTGTLFLKSVAIPNILIADASYLK